MSSTQPNYQSFPNRFYSGLTIRAEPSTSSSSNQSQGQGQHRKSKEDESPPVTPDSTTEPPPRPVQPFQEGDDVFFHTDNGQHILGTVGQIAGQTCQILFGDGTQQWASFKRIKKLSCPLDDDNEGDSGEVPVAKTEKLKKDVTKKVKQSSSKPPPRVPQTTELPCASCGILRRISQTKARQLEGEPNNLFKCRRCTNKSAPNETFPHSAEGSLIHAGPFIKPGPSKLMVPRQNKSMPDILSFFKKTNQGGFTHGDGSGQSSSTFNFDSSTQSTSKLNVQNPSLNKMPTLHPYMQLQTETILNCFHCEKGTKWYNSVQCNFCERPCHLLCLSMTPTPLNGDKFCDLTCSSCGTQNGNESGRIRVFSVRRKISSWSDIAHLIICCLSVNSQGQRFFDLNTDMYPFLEAQLSRLHLPSKYKLEPPDERKRYIEVALNNSKLRFINSKELGNKRSTTQWAIRSENFTLKNQQPIQNGVKNNLSSTSTSQVTTNSGKLPDSVRLKRKYVRKESPTKLKQSPKIPTKSATTQPEFQPQSQQQPKMISKRACEMVASLSIERIACDSPSKSKGKDDSIGKSNTRNLEVDFNTNPVPSPSSNSSSSSSTTSNSTSSSITSVEEVSPNKLSRGRGRPKGRVIKRALSPSSPPTNQKDSGISNSSSPRKKNPLIVRFPFLKKPKIDSSPPRKEATPPVLIPSVHRSTPSPTRPVQKVATLTTPPKKILPDSEAKGQSTTETSSSSEDDEEDDDSDSETEGQGVKTVEPERVNDDGLPRAVKSAAVIPIPAPQIQVLLREDILKSEKLGKPKISGAKLKIVPRGRTHVHLKSKSPSKASLLRLRPRGRGRPAGSKNLRARIPSNSTIPQSSLKSSLNGASKSAAAQVGQLPTKRSWNSGGASDRFKAQLQLQVQEKLALSNISIIPNLADTLLFNSALYGGYKLHCLPSAPETAAEKRKEALKVFAHYRTEKDDAMATLLLGRSETETRSQSRRKSELFGMHKRDLNDYDSYDVLGKRVDPDGTTRYFIAWKIPGLDDDSDDSDDTELYSNPVLRNPPVVQNLQKQKPVIDLMDVDEEDVPEYLVETGRNSSKEETMKGSPDFIDLTMDSS